MRLVAPVFGVLGLAACDDFRFPRDPDGTLDRVLTTGRMRVAAVDHVPWVIVDGSGAPRGAPWRCRASACSWSTTR